MAQDKAKRRHEEAWIEQKEAEHNERVAVTKALSDDKSTLFYSPFVGDVTGLVCALL